MSFHLKQFVSITVPIAVAISVVGIKIVRELRKLIAETIKHTHKMEWGFSKVTAIELRQCMSKSDLSTVSRLIETEFWEWLPALDERYFERLDEQLKHKHASSRHERGMPVSADYNALISVHVLKNIVSFRDHPVRTDDERSDIDLKLDMCKPCFTYNGRPFEQDVEQLHDRVKYFGKECAKQGVIVEPMQEYSCKFPFLSRE